MKSPVLMLSLALVAGALLGNAPLFRGEVVANRDVFRIAIPDSVLLVRAFELREWPLWNPYNHLGQPLAGTLQSQVFHPLRWLAISIAGPHAAPTVQHLFHVLLLGAGVFLAARTTGARRASASIAAVLLALGTVTTNLVMLPNISGAFAWSGFIVAASARLARGPGRGPLILLAVSTAMSLLSGAPETTLWQLALACAVMFRRRNAGAAIRGSLAIALGFMIAAIALLPAIDFALNAHRAPLAERLVWSNGWKNLLGPALLGANVPTDDYRGDQNLLHAFFLGFVPTGLAVLALCTRRRRRYGWVAFACAFLSLGASFPLAGWVHELPPFSLFRYPAKYFLGSIFVLALASAWGLDRVAALQRSRSGFTRRSRIIGASVAAVAIGAAALAFFGGESALAGGLVFAAIVGGLIAVFGPWRRARLPVGVIAIWLLEAASARAITDYRLWVERSALSPPSALASLIRDPLHFRVSTTSARDVSVLTEKRYIERSLDALVPHRNAEVNVLAVEGDGAPIPKRFAALRSRMTGGFYDRVSVRHFLRWDGPPTAGVTAIPGEDPELPEAFQRATALPRARVVHRARLADDEEALKSVLAPLERGLEDLTLQSAALPPLEECAGSSATITKTTLTRVEVEVDACGAGVLVLADTWHPGWGATIDGSPVEVLRGHFLLRAVPVSGGRHRVVFTYAPRGFSIGAALTALGLGSLVLLVGIPYRRRGPRRGEKRPRA